MKCKWHWLADGEANFYMINSQPNDWMMRVQMNGEIMVHKQMERIQLISVAPELLDACKDALHSIEHELEPHGRLVSAVEKLKEVIQMAENKMKIVGG